MTAFEIIKENLSSLKAKSDLLSEKRLYELSELADVIHTQLSEEFREGEWEESFFRLRVPELLWCDVLHLETPSEYLPFLKKDSERDLSTDLCAFSVFLAERIGANVKRPFPWREAERGGSRIAYIPSAWADRAYLALAGEREDAAVLYARSASAVVDALLVGEADFALLPYASAEGEPLLGIERLCARHDLCISALVTVFEGDDRPIYALVSTEPCPYSVKENMLLSLSLTADSYEHLGRLLSAFPLFGYRQRGLSCTEEEYGRIRGRITLEGEGNAIALYIYLSLCSVGFSILGRYPMFEI